MALKEKNFQSLLKLFYIKKFQQLSVNKIGTIKKIYWNHSLIYIFKVLKQQKKIIYKNLELNNKYFDYTEKKFHFHNIRFF